MDCVKFLFKGCSSLKYVKELEELQTANNKNGHYESMFENCISLKKVPKLINFRFLTASKVGPFKNMFKGCTFLKDASNFNMKKFIFDNIIPSECFYRTFYNCEKLTNVPDFYIPSSVTTIDNNAFNEMFYNCSSLITGPSLNELSGVTTINSTTTNSSTGRGTFCKMFYNCTSLTGGIEYLPSVSALNPGCFKDMFRDCSSLIITPQFSNLENIKTISTRCVNSTFNGCTSLISGIELPSCALNNSSEYYYLYEGCNSLNYVKVNFTSWNGTSTECWFANNTSSNGTFVCPEVLPKQRRREFYTKWMGN